MVPMPQLPWPPFQFDRRHEYRIDGITVLTGRVACSQDGKHAPRVWSAAFRDSDLRAGRGGIGTGWRGEDRAVENLFRMLRDRYLPPPPP